MKYLIAIVLAVSLSLGVAIPALSDTGVSVTLTTTVTGGSGGSSGFDSGDVVPYTPPNWASIFPSMNQPQSSSPVYVPPVQQPVPIPPVIEQKVNYTQLPAIIAPPSSDNKDWLVYLFIGLGAILIGLIIYLIIPEQKVR